MQKSVDAAAPDPTPDDSLPIGRAFRLITIGGLLQTIGETLALGASGAIATGNALVIFCSTALGVALLCAALWQPGGQQSAPTQRRQPLASARLGWLRRLAKSGLLVLLLLAALWTIATGGALLIQHPLDPSIYDSDAAAFIHYQAEDVLRGVNPYTDIHGFWNAVVQFPHAGATPLQRGQFARQTLSPDDAAVAALLHLYVQDPSHAGPEFDPASLHSYPAGSFLLAVPFIWAGFASTQPLYALCLLLLFALLMRWSPQGWRWQTALLLLSLSIAITLTLRSSFEVACMLCIIGAWRVQARHPWAAAFLLGVGCSIKQLAWLFLPFYLLWALRQRGWRTATLAGVICAGVFLLINAPFLLAAPSAWASSMLLPITEPAFPGGIGLITLAQGGLIQLFPSWAYSALEIAAYLGGMGWFSAQQFGSRAGSTTISRAGTWGLILAPLPLLLGSRSLISYTMFLPVLALAALFQYIHFRCLDSSSAKPLSALTSSTTGAALSNE
ncbi:MAG TPA: glycosyltransferase 87 family protein [Ktedonobacterales bacterium]